ncbi:RNA-binding protein Raly isoform X2 [Entelurus aequoreus]|uniref:RNA-binding protein Raly isoform X2 n=1 Tax=Entelurus aequoreus TaxID=161455 RepID=UPI002B1E3D9F|nr:RNA-binding protein Raly isoform X2 [Entelurus aequoreus]
MSGDKGCSQGGQEEEMMVGMKGGVTGLRMSLKVPTSNVTNKTDPKSINSRVFIGNLNTAVVSKSDVESIFSRYGRVLGCSVHKGYAFVQYANEKHAKGAVAGENGRVLAGQTLDINMAGEPKPSRDKPTKRPSSSHYSTYDLDYEHFRDDLYNRLMVYGGQVLPDARLVPVKGLRVAPPFVRRLTSLPVRTLPRNANMLPGGKHRLRGVQLRAIKSQLTQIKDHIEALLRRLDRIAKDAHLSCTERTSLQRYSEEEVWQGEECSLDVEESDEEDADPRPGSEGDEEEDMQGDNHMVHPKLLYIHQLFGLFFFFNQGHGFPKCSKWPSMYYRNTSILTRMSLQFNVPHQSLQWMLKKIPIKYMHKCTVPPQYMFIQNKHMDIKQQEANILVEF